MSLLPLVIENGLTANGDSTVTGSVIISTPLTNIQASGSFTGSFQGNGTNVTGAKAIISNMPAGTVISLYADETEDTGVANTTLTVKTYTLASNSYNTIIIETQCQFRQNAGAGGIATFNIVVGGVTKRSHSIEIDTTGGGDQFTMGRVLKYSESITGGATITVTVTNNTGTYVVDSLRIYGVI